MLQAGTEVGQKATRSAQGASEDGGDAVFFIPDGGDEEEADSAKGSDEEIAHSGVVVGADGILKTTMQHPGDADNDDGQRDGDPADGFAQREVREDVGFVGGWKAGEVRGPNEIGWGHVGSCDAQVGAEKR